MWGLDHSSGTYKKTNSNFLTWLWYTMMYLFGEQMNNISVAEIVLNELKHLHHQMKREKQLFFMTLRTDPMKNKRLLYLFQKDLLPGIHGMILEAKASRDEVILKGSSTQAKLLGWIYLGVTNVGMLFYILLFALTQPTDRQQAWGQSFALWLVAEIFIVGTLIVLIMHVWIPAITMTDVLTIQKKLTETISNYQKNLEEEKLKQEKAKEKKYLLLTNVENNNENSYEEQEQEKKFSRVRDRKGGKPQRKSVQGKLLRRNSEDEMENDLVAINETEAKEPESEDGQWKPFNATKYLFLSHRISKLYSDLTIAKIILNFNSPYPKQSYQYVANLSSSYEQSSSGVSRAFSILLLYFLTSLLSMPVSMQDMFIQATTTVLSGYFILIHYQLFQLSPMLMIVPVAVIGILLSVRQIMKKHGREEQERLKKLKLEMIEKENETNGIDNKATKALQEEKAGHSLSSASRTKGKHVTRRASVAQGIQTAQAALRSVARMTAHSELSKTNSSGSERLSSLFADEEEEDDDELLDGFESVNENDDYFGEEREEDYPVNEYVFDSDSDVDIDKISVSEEHNNFEQQDRFDLDDQEDIVDQNLHQPPLQPQPMNYYYDYYNNDYDDSHNYNNSNTYNNYNNNYN
jgi:low affinity Fe/Cu permease